MKYEKAIPIFDECIQIGYKEIEAILSKGDCLYKLN